MTVKDTGISEKEQKAIDHLIDFLGKEFKISADYVDVSMRRDVAGIESGMERKRDYISLSVTLPAIPRDAQRQYAGVIQPKLADELSKVWGAQNRPLVGIDIHYETADNEAEIPKLHVV